MDRQENVVHLEFSIPVTAEVDLATGRVLSVTAWDTESGPYTGAYQYEWNRGYNPRRRLKGGQVRRAIEAADDGQMWPAWTWG